MSEHSSGRRRSGRHPQPGERTVWAALTLLQEMVEPIALFSAEVFREKSEDLPLCTCHRLGTEAFDDSHRRKNDQPPSELLYNGLSENDPPRCLQGRGVEPCRDGSVMP